MSAPQVIRIDPEHEARLKEEITAAELELSTPSPPLRVVRARQSFLHKAVVKVYRFFAVVILYGVLTCVLSYGFMMLFYALNSSWIAPFIVVPTNDKILDLTSRVVMSQQSVSSMIVDRDRLQGGLADMKKELIQLNTLDHNFQTAIQREKIVNTSEGPELGSLDTKKVSDNQKLKEIIDQVNYAKAEIEKDLKIGLIAKGDAAEQIASLTAIANSYTDNQIAEMLVRAGVRQKSNTDVTAVDTLAKEAELKGNIVQLQIQIITGEEQLRTDKIQIAQVQEALNTAKGSPYFLATLKDVQFAFIPYANRDNVAVGSPVFNCVLNMIICQQVGTVKKIFKDEEHAVHPVFHNDIRGSLVQLELTEKEAAKNAVLFINHKPLLF